MHKQHVRSPADVGVYRHGKDKLVVLSVEVVKVIHPNLLNIAWIYPAVRVCTVLDKHHGREISEAGLAAA